MKKRQRRGKHLKSQRKQLIVENQKKSARTEGAEKALRTKADELGLDVQGSKRNIDNVFKAFETKILADAKIEPEEKLKKINEKLSEKEIALQNALSKISEKEKEFTNFKNQSRLDKKLDSYIPDNTLLPKEDMKVILKNKLVFDVDEDGNDVVLDAMGNILKDETTANPKNPKDVVTNFFKDNQSYLKPVSGGSGGGDDGSTGGKKSMDDFIADQSEKGNRVNSPEFNEALQGAVKAGLVDVD